MKLGNLKYFIKLHRKDETSYLQMSRNDKFAVLITNSFRTLTGGTIYYDYKNVFTLSKEKTHFHFVNRLQNKKTALIHHRTLSWISEEIHKVNCEQNILLVESGDFISAGFELIPGLFSKTSGLVTLVQKQNVIKTISIKLGLVYEGKKFKNIWNKVYYPGEVIFSNITVKNLAFCDRVLGKNNDQLLIRPITIYEFPLTLDLFTSSNFSSSTAHLFNLKEKSVYIYKPNQFIKGIQNLNLISNLLTFKINNSSKDNRKVELLNNVRKNQVDLLVIEKLLLTNYLPPNLRYKNIESCFLTQKNQFISTYTTLGYLEAVNLNSLEIVKFKIKKQTSKQIFLISNQDCVIIKKEEIPNKKLGDFIASKINLTKVGKVIIINKNFITIQKGRPYFFPNCKNEGIVSKTNLQYKLISSSRIPSTFETTRRISINYANITRFPVRQKASQNFLSIEKPTRLIVQFSKLFIKKNGKLYSCLIPKFIKKFTIKQKSSQAKLGSFLYSSKYPSFASGNRERTLLMQSSELVTNKNKANNVNKINYQLTLLTFIEQPFVKSTKSVGLYAITEDYFEQDVNSVFCKNTEFIEAGKTIGLLNLEKEITGDIVQGLPRIEEILEARKKNILIKRIATSQKKGLLLQKTSLDINFEFRKLGTTIHETDKINPHKLLKVYFNYYGLIKYFVSARTKSFKYNRLLNNYEGSYKSFKKVQLFILNSVQSVYKSQGVNINDKHLEVVIKQMTTKVLITYEGHTPLLRREVIDLYHIQYINQIIQNEMKKVACYIPLLLGITKAALNNPSFISAASFQETTRVLTKAAIEGRIDWLRGLKENIIIGHLIPAGTGSQNYRNCFKRQFN